MTYLNRKPRIGDYIEFNPKPGDYDLAEYGFIIGSKHRVLSYDSANRCLHITNHPNNRPGSIHHDYFRVIQHKFKLGTKASHENPS